jgi:hypothetical protein
MQIFSRLHNEGCSGILLLWWSWCWIKNSNSAWQRTFLIVTSCNRKISKWAHLRKPVPLGSQSSQQLFFIYILIREVISDCCFCVTSWITGRRQYSVWSNSQPPRVKLLTKYQQQMAEDYKVTEGCSLFITPYFKEKCDQFSACKCALRYYPSFCPSSWSLYRNLFPKFLLSCNFHSILQYTPIPTLD